MNDNIPAVFTVSELCSRWKCNRKTILAKINSGELVAFRVGERAYRVAASEVLRLERGTGHAA